MPPPPMNRFAPGGQNPAGFHQQFPGHVQHPASHAPQMPGYPANIHANPQQNPFANNNILPLPGAAAGFGLGGDNGLGHAARIGFTQAGNQQMSYQQQAAALQQAQQQAGQQQQQAQHQPQHQPQQHPQHAQHVPHVQHAQHAHQQQGQHAGFVDHPSRGAKGRIREVWKQNLEEEFWVLRKLVDSYKYIAMDTEFPGIVARPMGKFHGKNDYHYQCLRVNVDFLKLIQVGITLFNEHGELPAQKLSSAEATELYKAARAATNKDLKRAGKPINQGPLPQLPHAWQFNFNYNLATEMYNQTSIDSLQHAGIDFNALERDGIEPHAFAALLIPSGLCYEDDVHWISFHGGYDFGYLTKMMMVKKLPTDESEFDKYLKIHFPSIYDVKHLLKSAVKLHNSGMLPTNDPSVSEILTKFEQKSGLEHIVEALKLKRVGAAHQAGSDSLITGRVFFDLRKRIFNDQIGKEHLGKVWGLGIPDYSIGGSGAGITASAGNNANINNNTRIENTGGAGGTAGTENNTPAAPNGAGNNSAHQQQQQNGGTPSTPNTNPAGLAATPAAGAGAPNTNGGGAGSAGGGNAGNLGGMGPMTPGGGGGVFGAFAFNGGNR